MEEDIKILEEIVELYYDCAVIEDGFDMRVDMAFMKKETKALENLIKAYREYKNFYHRRLKEWRTKFENQEKHFLNELDEYDEEREKLKKQLDNSIPKSKVKEKIEELKEELERDRICIDFVIEHKKDIELIAKIDILEEILTPLKNV